MDVGVERGKILQTLHLPNPQHRPLSSSERERRASLPVDAYYRGFQLVAEYPERQHTEPVAFCDRRHTVSGMTRGEQRRRYDNLRRQVLPDHGYRLEIIEWRDLAHSVSGRLLRSQSDIEVIRMRLA